MQPVARPLPLRDVARAANVHISTVSRALNHDPHLPESTRERLKTLASEMGYRRQPLFAAMSHRRRRGRHNGGVPVIYVAHPPYERMKGNTGHMEGALARSLGWDTQLSGPIPLANSPTPSRSRRGSTGE